MVVGVIIMGLRRPRAVVASNVYLYSQESGPEQGMVATPHPAVTESSLANPGYGIPPSFSADAAPQESSDAEYLDVFSGLDAGDTGAVVNPLYGIPGGGSGPATSGVDLGTGVAAVDV